MKSSPSASYEKIQNPQTPVLGIGIDLVEVERIEGLLKRFGEHFLKKIFSQEELRDSFRHRNPHPSLAARFAAKEATAKALGIGIGSGFSWSSAVVGLGAGGKPEIRLDALGQGRARSLGVRHIELSLTHTRALAQAVVILSR
ncbi:MAG: holo-ACP synthase [Puniceicoccales bacterium]|jgi:holo-[acyl-carrier protein] synthase|nr:holo-ACP synthase [Puniceicoccales bacterium]